MGKMWVGMVNLHVRLTVECYQHSESSSFVQEYVYNNTESRELHFQFERYIDLHSASHCHSSRYSLD